MHAAWLSMHGMAPWARASTLPAALRAPIVALTAWATALLAAYGILRRVARTRVGVIFVGACGPLAALGLLRLLERADAPATLFAVLPVAACGCTWGFSALLSRLRLTGRAASKWIEVSRPSGLPPGGS
jgi:hypothetical protein